jgi:hypothetical protein
MTLGLIGLGPSRDRKGAVINESVRHTPSPDVWAIVETVTKKKLVAEPIIAPQILEMAKKSVEVERLLTAKPCAVCGASCTPLTGPAAAGEQELCWVCRRLKISAWRDADHQLSAQE